MLIGRELCSIRWSDCGNDMMVVRFVFFFLSCAIFRENLTEMDVKTVNVMVKKQNKTNRLQLSMVCTVINHKNVKL